MARIVLLDGDEQQRQTLAQILLDGSFEPCVIERVKNAADLMNVCLRRPPEIVLVSWKADDFRSVEAVMDELHSRMGWMQILLLLDERDAHCMEILRRRDERFLFQPLRPKSVLRILAQSLFLARSSYSFEAMSVIADDSHAPAASPLWRFLEQVEHGGPAFVMEQILQEMNLSFACGFAALLGRPAREGALERAQARLCGDGFDVLYMPDDFDGLCVILCAKRWPEGLSYMKQIILDDFTRESVPVFAGGITDQLEELAALLARAKENRRHQKSYIPEVQRPLKDVQQQAQNWALTVVITQLAGRPEDLPSFNRTLAEHLAMLSEPVQKQAMDIFQRALEKQMEKTYGDQKIPFVLNTQTDETADLFALLNQWSAQAAEHAALFCHKSHIVYLRQIYGAIIDHFREKDFSLEDVAQKLSLSAGYICLLMKKYTEYSFVEYLNQCRVHYAMRLLETDLMIRDVAPAAGFQSSTYFGRVFKNITGITPGEYRRQVHDAPETLPQTES